MSVELETRVLTPFTLADLLHRTTEIARTVLPHVPITMIGPTADYVHHGTAAPIPPRQLAATYGPGVQQPAPVLIAAGEAVSEIACLDHGNADDPELGVRLYVSAAVLRDNASLLLAALTTATAAQLGHSDVIDESRLVHRDRINPPGPLADALQHAATTTNTTAPPAPTNTPKSSSKLSPPPPH